MTAKELSEKTGLSTSRVYQLAKKLGRLPTIEELNERKGWKPGRPSLQWKQHGPTGQSGVRL